MRIPDLPSLAARDDMEAVDILIKSADWNPALHPRTGTPPNPGWFAPSGTEQLPPTRVAQSDTPRPNPEALSTVTDESSIRPSLRDARENPSLLVPVADNRRQNKQVRDIAVRLKLNDDQLELLHEEITGRGLNYHQILEIAKEMFGK